MNEQVTIKADTAEPSLEEQAKAAGIDMGKIDPTALSQQADPKPVEAIPAEEDPDLVGNAETEDDGEVSDEEVELAVEDGDAAQEAAEEATEKAGLDLRDVVNRYYENGEKLDEKDYEQLAAANYPRDLVDQFIEGRKAVVEAQRQTVFSSVGGEKTYTDMMSWAASTLSDKEIAAYNTAVNSNNMEEVLLAAKGLKARFESGRSVAPQRKVAGRTVQAPTVYTSLADLKSDMSNPRYSQDPAFRAKVEAKLARSSIL